MDHNLDHSLHDHKYVLEIYCNPSIIGQNVEIRRLRHIRRTKCCNLYSKRFHESCAVGRESVVAGIVPIAYMQGTVLIVLDCRALK